RISFKFSEDEIEMKVAVIGSRNLVVGDLSKYLPAETDEIVSGGARGIDSCAAEYAKSHGLKLTEFKPDYDRFGRGAPLKRNITIIEYADRVLAFWDGKSHGTKYAIEECKKRGVPVQVFLYDTTMKNE
ncbi:MAG: SLOG family protein, partial [Bacteroidia bacterium]|nr:SLOG family protein [Bacteroidia bacterium]